MATSRRTLKEHGTFNHSTMSPKLKANEASGLRNRHEYADDSENEFSKSEDEGTDEPDRCLTDFRKKESVRTLYPPLRDLSPQRFSHPSERTNCGSIGISNPNYTARRTPRNLKSRVSSNISEIESDVKAKRRHDGWTPFVLIGIVFMVILSMIALGHSLQRYRMSSSDLERKTLKDTLKDMERDLQALSKMTEQTSRFWIQILSQLEILAESSPLQPAIVLAMVPSDAQKTAACLSQRILEIVSSAFEDRKYISFDVHSHMGRNSTILKHDLDDFLQGLSGSHAAGVYNLEKLVPEAAMIFHAYCDHENAPYKRVFFLLTLEIGLSYSSLALDRLETTVSQYLNELWAGNLREDDSAAIISRIANAPVVFQPEKSETIRELCPY